MYKCHDTAKYQAILHNEHLHKITWHRVMKALAQVPLPTTQKKAVAKQVLAREASQTRLLRIKDRLANYELLGMIGKGAFGDVRLARVRESGTYHLMKDK
jgi:serine/threonine kinase 38